ncbi:MAG: L-histidine N(alpha)-methyltransferase [Gemmatimonadota bacterium]
MSANPTKADVNQLSRGPESTLREGDRRDSVESHDIVVGLTASPAHIPSKYFYDDRGSALFDAITELPEYYPARTEQALLDRVSDRVAGLTGATQLTELGAGSARKTRLLIRALQSGNGRRSGNRRLRYTPLDISRYALREAERSIREECPGVEVRGIRCDYTHSLEALDPPPGSLTVFLGSTIGNFPRDRAVRLLRRLRERLHPGDQFLLGVDLVKPVGILEAAYNDARGVTAEFNKNILRVVNGEAGGNFDPGDFDHLAFFNTQESQIEMHLVARRRVIARLERFNLDLDMEPGDRIRTEISRKFTRETCSSLLADSGFRVEHWFPSENEYFGLALARVEETPSTLA